ncbi:MAG: glycoside hydrolase family 3 C-terminal domain-containing protein [Lachnospiraceae bacterium]|nr:glycoside hydrolase family 3 C-terminal domain-containing protein [Lachnospiraceae bacterium]
MEKWTRALYQPSLPLGEDGRRVTAGAAHIALSKEAAKEGMVLLKNEDAALPLKRGANVALFGKATFDYVKGGGGSGDVTVPYTRNLYEGLAELNCVNIFEPLADFYRSYAEKQYGQGVLPGQAAEPEVTAELFAQARKFADTAVLSICRFSGEGDDRPKEDFYLSEGEKKLVEAVAENFERVIAVLNIGGVISAEWFRTEPRIQAALVAWQGGIEGGLAAAELLCGIGNPCGKLADTFAKEIEDYPSTASFGESDDYVEYTEDIYVGYRYFEAIPGAKEKVAYPFGYGLSYTTFDISCVSARVSADAGSLAYYANECLEFTACVKNTGSAAGREVVQLYVETPSNRMETAARKLVAFEKTPELAPGEACELHLSVPLKELASYDEAGVVEKSAWVMEAGDYHFYLGNSVRNVKKVLFTEDGYRGKREGSAACVTSECLKDDILPVDGNKSTRLWKVVNGTFYLASDLVVEICSQKMTPQKPFPRLGRDGSYTYIDNCSAQIELKKKSPLSPLKWEEMECVIPATRAIPRRCFLLKEEPVPQLMDVYRTCQQYGSHLCMAESAENAENGEIETFEWPENKLCGEEEGAPYTGEPLTLVQFVRSLPDRELAELLGGQPNTGVANTYGVGNLPRYGVPNIMTADGPAGLRIEKKCGVSTTAWPCATGLACSWNPALAEQVGRAAAEEVKENNIGIWLAPAVNIHRNPLCGRNFEYYSEDPRLAGLIGAGMVRGIQSQNIAATVKHFALNNKERNRKESDSRASERAIREIYLRVFEIIVKEAKPWAIMSSYNIINGVRASERKDMLTDILRGEWGYEGVVMTDWWAFSEEYKEILAGNDLKMGCGYPERLLEAMEQGLIARADLERSATRILELILKID